MEWQYGGLCFDSIVKSLHAYKVHTCMMYVHMCTTYIHGGAIHTCTCVHTYIGTLRALHTYIHTCLGTYCDCDMYMSHMYIVHFEGYFSIFPFIPPRSQNKEIECCIIWGCPTHHEVYDFEFYVHVPSVANKSYMYIVVQMYLMKV